MLHVALAGEIAEAQVRQLQFDHVGDAVVLGLLAEGNVPEDPAEAAPWLLGRGGGRGRQDGYPGPLPGEQVLYTGDYCRMDAEGYLYFVGRGDEIIKSRGEKVAPKEVETVLMNIPTMFSMPGTSGDRPVTVAPNTTSL